LNTPAKRTRIACAHLYDDFSGSGKVFAHALTELAASGAELRIVVGSAGKSGFIRAAHPAETIFYRFRENRLLLLLLFGFAQLQLFFRILKLCLFWRADIVYANTVLTPGATLAARLCGRRVVVHMHEVGLGSRLLFRTLLGVTRRTAHRFLCVSKYVRDALTLPGDRAVVVYNSLSQPEWQLALKTASTHSESAPFKVFMACSLKWYKGIDSFLELARREALKPASTPRVLRFQLALNCTEAEWREFAGTAALPPNVDIVFRPPAIYPLYGEASVVLNLSHPEGWIETFGMTLLEAMASAVPVICPTVGGCTELFEDGDGGWRISARDLPALEAVIDRLRRDPAYLLRCRAAASANAQRFDPAGFATALRAAVLSS